MIPYENASKECAYGHFNMDGRAGYTLTDAGALKAPWYYIYSNRKILLYADQNGPVKIQHRPPSGIFLIRRELGENQSKWLTWVQCADINDGIAVSNFHTPNLSYTPKAPQYTVQWLPEKAIYRVFFDNAEIVTELFVPRDRATVCMKVRIENTGEKEMAFTVTPAMYPYINVAQMVAWDLPEWYLSSKLLKNQNRLTFHGQMSDPGMDMNKFHSVTLNTDYEADAQAELVFSEFAGNGNFFSPDAVKTGAPLSYRMEDAHGESFSTFTPVYAARYQFSLKPGQKKTLTQVLTVQEDHLYNQEENHLESIYFDETGYEEKVAQAAAFYDDLFKKRTVHTNNPVYDDYVNAFVPLQMYWVGSLDRGWPSSMQGTRDASQDFIGLLPLYPDWARQTILRLFTHQQTDGWMPRQISTISRTAPHDMRAFCDGGAFLLELVCQYLKFTRDTALLEEKVPWLNSDENATVLEHLVRCTDYYIRRENIGEHHLCKVWNGDWWDIMDKIGLDGRGESVTVTAQVVLDLQELATLFKWLVEKGKADASYLQLAEEYLAVRERFIQGMLRYAFNSDGYFNGYFNDNGKWLLSPEDPDGEKRVYLVANAWALMADICDEEMRKSVLDNIEAFCFGKVGYDAYNKGYPKYVDKAGRVGNGTIPGTTMYNHAQSFFALACCLCGDAQRAYKVTRYILPLEQNIHPVEKTLAPQYALTNKYSNNDKTLHRASFQFLSGTTSYCLRILYNGFFGIRYDYEGLWIKPCLPEAFGDCSVEFTFTGKKITAFYKKTENEEKTVLLNGEKVPVQTDSKTGKPVVYFPDALLRENNKIKIEY